MLFHNLILDKIAPMKQKRIKNDSQEWFDRDITEKIAIRDKNLKKFRKTKFHIDKDIYNKSNKEVKNTIKQKKQQFFINKLNENIGKPKELWKALKL